MKVKQYKDYINDEVYEIYEFQYFSISDIEKLDFDNSRKWRICKFLDYVYRVSLRKIKDEEYREVYISNKIIEGILGKYYYKDLIEFLNDNDLITHISKGNNKYDYRKKLSHFKMNQNFYDCKKKRIKIEYGVLNRWLERRKNGLQKMYEIDNKDEFGNVVDEFVKYEMNCCKNSDVVIEDLDKIVELRINNKISELQNESLWSWMGKKKIIKIENNFNNRNEWLKKYQIQIQNRYQTLKEDLYNIKKSDYEFLQFNRDEFGERLYNLYSRVIKEYRKFIKIDNEVCVELDIKGSHISCLYYLIVELNNSSCKNEFISDIRNKLNIKGNYSLGKGFLEKHKLIFENDGVFWSENEEIDEYNDFYGFMKSCFNDGSDRNEYKKFTNYILNSNTIRFRKNFNYKGYNIDELEKLFFGEDGYELINDLKDINLQKWFPIRKGRKKKYTKHTNISFILHRLENELMDVCRRKLMDKNIKYISMFDSFIVKEKDSVEILKMLNRELKNITSVIHFVLGVQKFKNFI